MDRGHLVRIVRRGLPVRSRGVEAWASSDRVREKVPYGT